MKQRSFPLFTTSQLLNSISLLKPYIETQQEEEKPVSVVEKQARAIMAKDIIKDLDPIIDEIEQLVKSP